MLNSGTVDGVRSIQQQIRDRAQGVTIPLKRLNDSRQRLRCVKRRIVKENDASPLHLTQNPLCDFLRRNLFPVQTVPVRNNGKGFCHSMFSPNETPFLRLISENICGS